MTRRDVEAVTLQPNEPAPPRVERLLFIADAAVADMDELPTAVRAVIEAAAEVYVVTPTFPGGLRGSPTMSIGSAISPTNASTRCSATCARSAPTPRGVASRGSVLRVIADAVEEFKPDHILIALRSSEHANWQERRLIAHVEERFGLPVTTYAVDLHGHTSIADGPLILCYDGSAGARDAIQHAAGLFAGRRALVLTVWQPVAVPGSLGMGGEAAPMVDFAELDQAAAERGGDRRRRGRPHRAERRPAGRAAAGQGHRPDLENDP